MKEGKALEVDPLLKNGFKFWVYFLLVFKISVKYCLISFLYLNCKLFEVCNPRINKAIIILLTFFEALRLRD